MYVLSLNRYQSTLNHVLQWHEDSESRSSSLKKVRQLHTAANATSLRVRGVAMTQFDMVVTQWAFVGPILLFPGRVGLRSVTEEDMEALAHHMYGVGYVLGVSHEFNLCAGSLDDVRAYCAALHRRVVKPCLDSPAHDDSVEMAAHLLRGMNLFNPGIRLNSFTANMMEIFEADDSLR